MNDFLNTGKNLGSVQKAPRPSYRVVGNQANGMLLLYHGSFSINGLEKISFTGSIEGVGGFISIGYYNPKSGAYSGVALVSLDEGNKLEVSLNGLGKNKARQKVHRAVTQYRENQHLADNVNWDVGLKRAQHKKVTKDRKKQESPANPAPIINDYSWWTLH